MLNVSSLIHLVAIRNVLLDITKQRTCVLNTILRCSITAFATPNSTECITQRAHIDASLASWKPNVRCGEWHPLDRVKTDQVFLIVNPCYMAAAILIYLLQRPQPSEHILSMHRTDTCRQLITFKGFV